MSWARLEGPGYQQGHGNSIQLGLGEPLAHSKRGWGGVRVTVLLATPLLFVP